MPRRGSLRRLTARILAIGAIVAGAACSLVAGLDKFQFNDSGCAEPCDDSNPCTVNDCLVAGACQGKAGPNGVTCTTDGGLPGACVVGRCAESCTDGGCDDMNPCTLDTCEATQTCRYTNLTDGTLPPMMYQPPGDCHTYRCVAGVSVNTVDDMDVPEPDNPCRMHICNDGGPSAPALPTGTICGDGGAQTCNDAGSCGCIANGDCTLPETCGGGGNPGYCGCTPRTCSNPLDTCDVLKDGCGGTAYCNNGVKDGTETDVDCGGPAPGPGGGTCSLPCGDGKKCNVGSDCTSTFCANGVCCNAACDHSCVACDLANRLGVCSNILKNTHDNTPPYLCNGTGVNSVCDGAGNCVRPMGAFCTASNQCVNFCKANVCH